MNAPIPPDAIAVPTLPIAEICRSPYNRKRFDEKALEELADSIKVRGVIQPVTVRPNPKGAPLYELVIGERRWRAAQMAGLTEIPAFWRNLDDQAAIEMQAIENLQREDVHPIEEAESFELLMQPREGHPGYKAEDIAAKIGMSRSYVYASLKLLALCPEARDAFFAKKFEASIALLIARIPGQTLQNKAMQRIISGDVYSGDGPMSVRRAKDYIQREFMISLKQATFSLTDISLVPVAGACINCKKCTGNDPALFTDVEDPDVCTDTKCFDEKRKARQALLIEQAEAHQIPVLRGEEAKKVMPHGRWSIDKNEYIHLDSTCQDDAEGRSYRQILGDAAPVATIIVDGEGDDEEIIELAQPTALKEALTKAGIQPAKKKETADQKASRLKQEAADREREAKREQLTAIADREFKFREALFTEIQDGINNLGNANIETIVRAITIAAVVIDGEWSGDLDGTTLKTAGYDLPDSYDDDELPKVAAHFRTQSVGTCLAYLATCWTREERRGLNLYDCEDGKAPQALILATFAEMLGLDVPAIRKPFEIDVEPATDTPPADAPRPDIPYALWGPSGWQTWSGKGKKPAWVTQWLANGKTLEDLEAEKPVGGAPDAGPAAQAQEQGAREPAAPAKAKAAKAAKTPKAKTTPAPATPANEPAARVETSASGDAAPVKTARQAWPFPTGSAA